MFALAAAFLLLQIAKPPEFEDSPAFKAAAPVGIEGTSHVSSQREETSQQLVAQLARFPAGPEFTPALRLLQGKMLGAAAEAFAKPGAPATSMQAGRAVCQFLLGQYDGSAATLLALAAAHPGDQRVLELIGETAGVSVAHAAEMERRLRAGGARYHLARLIAKDRMPVPPEAIALWKESARVDVKDPRPCLELARTSPTDAGAIHWLKQALARDPNLADPHYRLSRLYQRTGQPALATRHLERFRTLKALR